MDMLVKHVIALSWFRCLMEEGYDFINKFTQEIETNEVAIYTSFKNNTGAFDLPAAKCTPRGLEKNLLEVLGNLVLYNTNPDIFDVIKTKDFTDALKQHIQKIRAREFSGKLR